MEESTQADSSRKSRRAPRPCDSCRNRKSRCIINTNTGVCTSCETRRNDCTFTKGPPRRPKVRSESQRMQVATPPSSDIAGLRPIAPGYQSNLGRTVWTPTCSSNSNDVAPTVFIDARQSSQPRTLPTFESRMPGAAPPTTVPPDIDCHETNASLGLAPSNFSELYGLTSDMEPILMVCLHFGKILVGGNC